jgi:hypothetical protein
LKPIQIIKCSSCELENHLTALETSSIKDCIFGTLKGVQNLQPLSKE